jgi:asparagine synthase (glutamine-hydrolysing)
MCGIAGVFYFNGRAAEPTTVKAMTDAIKHRGPDGEGVYVDGPIGLGHRRLSIIDLSSVAGQPLCNEDGTIYVTFNGEIYNFVALRAELEARGHVFRSMSDTEVIVHSYEEWGTDCANRFNGMFAFGVWDTRRQMLWLVRDRLGVKPLFYACSSDQLLFGSEIKALLAHSGVDRAIDYEALAYFLALNYTPAPWTLFANIRQLLPGQSLIVNLSGQIQLSTYWDLVYDETGHTSEKQAIEEFSALLEDSIRLRLMSDVPFGAFLSGGVDSSTVSYWMSRHLHEPLKTFSIGFGEASFDELHYARQVATLIGADHHERTVNADMATILPKIVWHSEEPTADSSMVAVYYLAQLAREKVTMALSGDGADEILAGYETYQAYYAQQLFRAAPWWLRTKVIAPLINSLPVSDSKVSLDFKLKRFVKAGNLSAEDAHASWRMIFDAESRQRLLAPIKHQAGVSADMTDLYRASFAQTNAKRPLNRMLYVDTRFYLPNDMLVKVDRMSMAHGLEAREPFLDYRLVELVARLPANLKLKRFRQKKYLLKAAMRDKLPSSILQRKKQGFNVPNARWISGNMKPFVMETLSPVRLQSMALFDSTVVSDLLQRHFGGQADNSHQIWSLLTLSLWWEQFS